MRRLWCIDEWYPIGDGNGANPTLIPMFQVGRMIPDAMPGLEPGKLIPLRCSGGPSA